MTVIGSFSTSASSRHVFDRRRVRERASGAGRAPSSRRTRSSISRNLAFSLSFCRSSDFTSAFSSFCSVFNAVVLLPDLDLLEPAQATQAHVQDRLGLHVRELERLHQLWPSARPRIADDLDHLVDVQEHDQIAVQNLEPVGDLRQPMARSGGSARRADARGTRPASASGSSRAASGSRPAPSC